jgi:hypothetical protein
LSTHALRTSESQGSEPASTPADGGAEPGLRLVRYLDLVLLALALPLFLLAGLPMLGYGAAATAWLVQRGINALVIRRATASDDLRTVAGLVTGSMIARGWLVALAIFAVGLSDNEAGLAAAVLTIALVTVYFTLEMAFRPFKARR